MQQKPDNLESQLHELGNIPVPGSLLKNIQAQLGQLTPEWAARQYQLGHESRNLGEGERGKNLAMAISHFQNVLQVYTSEAFPLQRVEVLSDVGRAYRDLSDLPEKDRLTNLEEAVACYKEARNVAQEHHLPDEWIAQLDLAISECYQQRIQELKHRADVEKAIADVLRLNNQRESALDDYNQALRLYRLVESRLDEAIVLKDLGDVHGSLHNMDAAMQHYQQALVCFKQMDHRHDVAAVLQAMGDIAQARHEDAIAEQYYQQALGLFRQVGDRFSEASVLASMGTQAKVALYHEVGEAKLSPMEFRSYQEHIAVLDRPVPHKTSGGTPAETRPGISPQPEDSEKPGNESLVTHTSRAIVRQRKQTRKMPAILLILFLIGVVLLLIEVRVVVPERTGISDSSCASAKSQLPASAHGIGEIKTDAGECIGLSDGSVAFDINPSDRADSLLKQQAAEKLAKGDRNGALDLLQKAVKQDGSDAEARIYLEDLQVLESGQPYITLIMGTKLTGDRIDLTGERRSLQGAYIAQQEYNKKCVSGKCPLLRLLIANSGNDANNAKNVANQIVQAAKSDRTIIGLQGWSVSQDTVNVVNVLRSAQLPMVGPSPSSDWLTGISPYFFRVSPPDSSQAALGASYAMNTLHAQRIALFVDPSNAYSASLADAFKQNVKSGSIVMIQPYTVGTYAQNKELASASLHDVLRGDPDLIYFSGYSGDAGTLLEELAADKQFAHIPVMGGDNLYNLIGGSVQPGLDRLIFTAFASPDEWPHMAQSVKEPPFFNEYAKTFGGPHADGNTPTGDAILSYDAMQVLLQASQIAFTSRNGPVTSQDLQQALKSITGSHAVQGVSGQIAFGQDGDPQNKIVVILNVDEQGKAHIIGSSGTFLLP